MKCSCIVFEIMVNKILHFWIGSTDTVSYSTQGVNDPVTSALHIILGNGLLTVF